MNHSANLAVQRPELTEGGQVQHRRICTVEVPSGRIHYDLDGAIVAVRIVEGGAELSPDLLVCTIFARDLSPAFWNKEWLRAQDKIVAVPHHEDVPALLRQIREDNRRTTVNDQWRP